MLTRFCFYGLLKNQRYFESFWILAFLDMGLSYAMIGGLIGFREISIAVMEIPTGAIADVVGRRWSMIFSHVAYIIAFLTFGLTSSIVALFLAMFAFAIGEAFRTGTHKAMIFSWLKRQGREKEKTHVYGITRSWSKLGSAISVVIAASFVFILQEYSVIFWVSAVPAALNVINFLGYSEDCEERSSSPPTFREINRTLWQSISRCVSDSFLRRPLVESMGFEGMYNSSKDYLQPIIQQSVITLPVFLTLADSQRTAVMIAMIYSILHLLSSYASRQAGPFLDYFTNANIAARWLWVAFTTSFVFLLVGTLTSLFWLSVASFITLAILENLWRPILMGRIADHAEESSMATVLSVESQAKSLGVAIIAPLLGVLVSYTPENYRFAPVAIIGVLIGFLMSSPRLRTSSA